jgi:hypothetical protein
MKGGIELQKCIHKRVHGQNDISDVLRIVYVREIVVIWRYDGT